MGTLLQVRDLQTQFNTEEASSTRWTVFLMMWKRARRWALSENPGCGKSVSALSILRLIPNPPGKIVGGEILFEGQDILKMSEEEVRHIRGNRIAMVFQEPMTSLNPVLTIGRQLTEALGCTSGWTRRGLKRGAMESLEMVGIPAAANRLDDYPHQFSAACASA